MQIHSLGPASGGRFNVVNSTLLELIFLAYGPPRTRGGPIGFGFHGGQMVDKTVANLVGNSGQRPDKIGYQRPCRRLNTKRGQRLNQPHNPKVEGFGRAY
jgi:hypothetical protein